MIDYFTDICIFYSFLNVYTILDSLVRNLCDILLWRTVFFSIIYSLTICYIFMSVWTWAIVWIDELRGETVGKRWVCEKFLRISHRNKESG